MNCQHRTKICLGAPWDGYIEQCACGQWTQKRYEGSPPPSWRGQWSGWVIYPISARHARKIQKTQR